MEGLGFAKSTRRTFHDTPYVVAVSGDTESLKIEVEHAEDGRRWKAKFAASFIEEITQRSGNAKKFDIFVRMMLSALAQESDAVYLDVLTARDLEMLRRHANPQGPPTTSTVGQSDKRYIILTYRAEFDKVHYPLPLPPEERSEEESLRAVVSRLRADLAEAHETIATLEQRGPVDVTTREDESTVALQRQNAELADALRIARREAEQLKAELRHKRPSSAGPSSSGGGDPMEVNKLKGQVVRLQAELKSMKEEARQAEIKHKREYDQLTRDLRTERQKAERLQTQVRNLQGSKPYVAPSDKPRSRPTSRSPSVERARPPSRPPSRPTSRPTSRAPSRASSVASSRERTPSPSRFLNSSGGGRKTGPPMRGSDARPLPQRRSVSPGGGIRRSAEQQKGNSPQATLSPYRRSVSAAMKRDPSPVQRGRERTPSPSRVNGVGSTVTNATQRPAANLNGRVSTDPVSMRYNPGLKQSSVPRAAASRGGRGPDGFSQDCYPRAGSRGPAIPPPPCVDDSNDRHHPGSLSALAANLGLGPGTLGGASVTSSGSGGGGGTGTIYPPEAVETCDIDARLQALQSFLKQTKNISG